MSRLTPRHERRPNQKLDSIEQVHFVLISHRPYGTGDDCWMLTQDCATLFLGYYLNFLREKDCCRFHLSRVGEAGGRLERNKVVSSIKQEVFMEFYGLPLIGQETSDEWGTV